MLKKIGSNARYEHGSACWNAKRKFKTLGQGNGKNWRDSDFLIKNFGYDKKEI